MEQVNVDKLLTLGGLVQDIANKEDINIYKNTPLPEEANSVKLIVVCTLPDGTETTRILGDVSSFITSMKIDEKTIDTVVFAEPAHMANTITSLIDAFVDQVSKADVDPLSKIVVATEFVTFIGKELEGAVANVMGSINKEGQQKHNEDIPEAGRKDNVRPLQRS